MCGSPSCCGAAAKASSSAPFHKTFFVRHNAGIQNGQGTIKSQSSKRDLSCVLIIAWVVMVTGNKCSASICRGEEKTKKHDPEGERRPV